MDPGRSECPFSTALGVRRVKSAKGIPVSLAVVEDFLRSKGPIQLREEVMP